MKLLIIESPGKIKTLTSFLPDDYKVLASVGHITEIPRSGLNIRITDRSFKPLIVFREDRRSVLKEIKEYSEQAEEIIICTDPDREGERIAFDLAVLIGRDKNIKRTVFHEITKEAVLKALDNLGEINMNIVSSQLARSILDRLIGYIVSPKLWEHVADGTSAGRVQSVALRLLRDREGEIEAFVPDCFWYINAEFNGFSARYRNENGERLVDETLVNKVVAECQEDFVIESNDKTMKKREAYPPFDTSGLQQAASVNFGWSGKKTMEVAQKAYELGKITYHRSDSFTISEQAVGICRNFIKEKYGKEYVPAKVKKYTKKTLSQEAHECIRPTALEENEWTDADDLNEDGKKLLELITNRFIACQMADMQVSKNEITLTCGGHKFVAEGKEVIFDGWSKVWQTSEQSNDLPKLSKSDIIVPKSVKSKGSSTKPPGRYNDASLVAKMEKEGVGRPSTWAHVVDTLLKKGYTEQQKRKFYVTDLGKDVCDYLISEYDEFFMDINFTSKVEKALDRIQSGELSKLDVIRGFYLALKKLLDEQKERGLKEFLEA